MHIYLNMSMGVSVCTCMGAVHVRGCVCLHPPSPLTPHLPRLAVRDLPLMSIGHGGMIRALWC